MELCGGKVTIDEFLNCASNAFHNIQNIDSVGLLQYAADDGPNGFRLALT